MEKSEKMQKRRNKTRTHTNTTQKKKKKDIGKEWCLLPCSKACLIK